MQHTEHFTFWVKNMAFLLLLCYHRCCHSLHPDKHKNTSACCEFMPVLWWLRNGKFRKVGERKWEILNICSSWANSWNTRQILACRSQHLLLFQCLTCINMMVAGNASQTPGRGVLNHSLFMTHLTSHSRPQCVRYCNTRESFLEGIGFVWWREEGHIVLSLSLSHLVYVLLHLSPLIFPFAAFHTLGLHLAR